MKSTSLLKLVAAAALLLATSLAGLAQDVFLRDIYAHPERYYNLPVTVNGTVQAVTANPAGTQRGQYTITDDSSTTPLTVKTEQLPKIGQICRISGTLVADPARDNVPMLKEEKRSSAGSSSTTLLLVLAGAALLVLLFVLLRVLAKPKAAKAGAPVIKTVGKSAAPAPPDLTKTIRVPPAAAIEAAAKTQVFLNLGAVLVVEKGADAGKEFPIHTLSAAIGRPGARKNDIELTDGTVSKEQATLRYDNAKKEFSLVNESQTNPTRVNQAEISGPMVIADGAVIEIGKTVLRFKKS